MGAFVRDYGLNNISIELQNLEKFNMFDYFIDPQGKMYRYNISYNGRYFCENNIIFDENGQLYKYDGNMYMVVDYYIFDFYNSNVYNCFDEADNYAYTGLYTIMGVGNNRCSNSIDSLPYTLGRITKMSVKKSENKTKTITITSFGMKDIIIVIDKHNSIIEYHNPNLKKIPNNFMRYIKTLKVLDLPNVVEIGDNCLHSNFDAISINLPKVKKIGNGFFSFNTCLESLNLPNVTKIGDKFLYCNKILHTFNAPKLKYVDEDFMLCNHDLTELSLPSLEFMEDSALCCNSKLKNVHLPRLKQINGFVFQNLTNSSRVYVPKCKNVENIWGGAVIER